jgi:hypothetical protein
MTVKRSGTCKPSVVVRQKQGEYLHYKIVAQGANPQFAFGCAHRHILSAENFSGHPMETYQWVYLKSPADADAVDDVYATSVMFMAATKYSLTIEHRATDDSVVETVCDMTFESGDPTDIARSSVEVFCV